MKHRLSFFILLFILILGFLLRVVNLQNLPHGFFCDEASRGYNAYKILMTGKDEHGVPYPFFFRCFGDYMNPVGFYLMIPSIFVFGLNEFSVRLTSAFAGVLTIVALYLLVKEAFPKNKMLSLVSAFFLAISPWHIHFSRTGFEFIYLPLFFTIALYLFLKGTKKKLFTPFSFLVLGIAFYTYGPAQIQILAFLAPLLFIFRDFLFSKTRVKNTILSLSFFLICLLPFLIGIRQGVTLTRFQSVSIFKEGLPLPKLVMNITASYFGHFSFDFLFKKGDIEMPGQFITRHSVRGVGQLYFFQLPLIFFGILAFWRLRRRRELALFFWWLVIYPLGSIFTPGGPYANRSIIGVIPFQILSAVGAFCLKEVGPLGRSNLIRKILALLLLFLTGLAGVEFTRYLHLYYKEYPQYSSDYWGWQSGPREIMKYFMQEKDKYDELYLSGQFNAPYIFLKFYDPKGVCNNCFIGGLDKLNFSKKQLFALRVEELKDQDKESFQIKKLIYYPSGEPAFFIGEVVK